LVHRSKILDDRNYVREWLDEAGTAGLGCTLIETMRNDPKLPRLFTARKRMQLYVDRNYTEEMPELVKTVWLKYRTWMYRYAPHALPKERDLYI